MRVRLRLRVRVRVRARVRVRVRVEVGVRVDRRHATSPFGPAAPTKRRCVALRKRRPGTTAYGRT